MILRRVRKHVQAQDWFAVGVDFLVVVLGILLAFQITECSNRSALHAQQRAATRDMLGESVEIVRFLRTEIAQSESRLARQDEAVAALASREAGRMTPEEIANALNSLRTYPAITPPRDVYDTLAGSGNLDLIADRGARREISRYYAGLRYVEGQLDYFRDVTTATFNPDHAGLVATYDAEAPHRRRYEADLRKLSADPQYVEDAVSMLRNQLVFHRYRRDLLQQAESMCLMLGEAAGLPCIAYDEEKP